MADKPKFTNRLIGETSEYLLQHAHDPVDWFPWGDLATKEAKIQDKPIFLSLGYSTCHWCHTMQQESFNNVDIAKQLNGLFINVLVDREELPEVDGLYMEFAQSLMLGASGWPLNVILTPNLYPFFATTYLPPFPKDGMMGLVDLIDRIRQVWHGKERETITQQAKQIVEIFTQTTLIEATGIPPKKAIKFAIEVFYKIIDPLFGGIKGIPKFPLAYQSTLLMQYSYLENESRALFSAEKTLDMMQRGGIYDHVGGGFSRYASDEKWLIPHFEKMLYDNALLIESYMEAWRLTKKQTYIDVCRGIIQYVLREMTGPDGGFYSAQDADIDNVEGRFYTWTKGEIEQILGSKAPLFIEFYGVSEKGHIEGQNVLHMERSLEEYATQNNVNVTKLADELNFLKNKLLVEREQRKQPIKDKKILSSWNGLMIHSLLEAGITLHERSYIEAAKKSAEFIRNNLWLNGELYRSFCLREVKYKAGLDEYAFLIRGLITLFEAGEGDNWLLWVFDLVKAVFQKFKSEEGGYYQSDGQDANLILRRCLFADGAEPSGNAIMCENLLRLYQITFDSVYKEQAEDIFSHVKTFLDIYSPGYSYHVLNLLRYYNGKKPTFVVVLNEAEENIDEIKKLIYSNFIPHREVIIKRKDDTEIENLIPFLKDYIVINDQTTVYKCLDGVCKKPVTNLNDIKEIL